MGISLIMVTYLRRLFLMSTTQITRKNLQAVTIGPQAEKETMTVLLLYLHYGISQHFNVHNVHPQTQQANRLSLTKLSSLQQ